MDHIYNAISKYENKFISLYDNRIGIKNHFTVNKLKICY